MLTPPFKYTRSLNIRVSVADIIILYIFDDAIGACFGYDDKQLLGTVILPDGWGGRVGVVVKGKTAVPQAVRFLRVLNLDQKRRPCCGVGVVLLDTALCGYVLILHAPPRKYEPRGVHCEMLFFFGLVVTVRVSNLNVLRGAKVSRDRCGCLSVFFHCPHLPVRRVAGEGNREGFCNSIISVPVELLSGS